MTRTPNRGGVPVGRLDGDDPQLDARSQHVCGQHAARTGVRRRRRAMRLRRRAADDREQPNRRQHADRERVLERRQRAERPGALEADANATITNTRIAGNTATVTAPTGDAAAIGAVGFFFGGTVTPTMTNTTVTDNSSQRERARGRRHGPGRRDQQQRAARTHGRPGQRQHRTRKRTKRLRAGRRDLERPPVRRPDLAAHHPRHARHPKHAERQPRHHPPGRRDLHVRLPAHPDRQHRRAQQARPVRWLLTDRRIRFLRVFLTGHVVACWAFHRWDTDSRPQAGSRGRNGLVVGEGGVAGA